MHELPSQAHSELGIQAKDEFLTHLALISRSICTTALTSALSLD